jgi:hypothetical protein
MGKASYVCARCSQDFTRKWSAERHNRDLHFGCAEIVRVLDYIIGRLSGKYVQANPLECRTGCRYRGLVGFDYCCEPIQEDVGEQRKRERRGNEQMQRDFIPRIGPNRSKSCFPGLENNGKNCDLFGATRCVNEFNRKSIYKNSEVTREEKLDEMRAFLARVRPDATEWEMDSMVRAVSVQSDYCIDDYWKWLRDLPHI